VTRRSQDWPFFGHSQRQTALRGGTLCVLLPSYTEKQLALNHHRPIIEGVLAPQRHLVPGAPREIGRTSREPRPCPALRASAPSFRDAVDVGSSSTAEDRDEIFTRGISARRRGFRSFATSKRKAIAILRQSLIFSNVLSRASYYTFAYWKNLSMSP
jgi:hypothetical protein